MADKPTYKLARDERKGTGSMEIEGVIDATKPKTSFTDKNLEKPDVPGDPSQTVSSAPAKSGGSISPQPNALKQKPGSGGSSTMKSDPEGLTKT